MMHLLTCKADKMQQFAFYFFYLQKFHRDLPATPVFAYGTTKENATVPGPTIEALHGVHTHI